MWKRGVFRGMLAAAVAGLAVCAWHFCETADGTPPSQQVAKTAVVEDSNAAAREHVIQLPEDGGAHYLTLMLHDDWRRRPNERELVAWFESDVKLRSLKAQCRWNIYTPSDPLWKTRYAQYANTLPVIMLQSEDGKVVYKESGPNVAEWYPGKLFERCRPFCKPKPKPEPKPEPTPTPGPEPDEVIPDTVIPDTPVEEPFPWAVAIVAMVVAAIAAVVWNIRKEGGA